MLFDQIALQNRIARLERAAKTSVKSAPVESVSGDPSGGVSGFSVDTNGDLILTYAGAPTDVSIDGDGNLILEM